MGLSDDEVTFHDALADNESACDVMGDDKLRFLAQEPVSPLCHAAPQAGFHRIQVSNGRTLVRRRRRYLTYGLRDR